MGIPTDIPHCLLFKESEESEEDDNTTDEMRKARQYR